METAEQIAEKEASESLEDKNQKAIDDAAAVETQRLADEEKAEIASYGDSGDGPHVEEPKEEEETKEPLAVPGTGEPGYVEPSEAKKEAAPETETEKKQREQIENINKANKEARDENKSLKDEIEKLKAEPAKPKVEVDPDVKETVKAVNEELAEEAATKTAGERTAFAEQTADEARGKHGAAEYDRITNGYFGPALESDPELLAEFKKSDNPGEFAFQKGKELYNQAQEEVIKNAEEAGRKNTLKELTDMGIPVTLSAVPGGGPAGKPPAKQDFDDY